MAVERFNTTQNRLDFLNKKGVSKMLSKEHKEWLSLKTAHSGFADEWDLQQCLKTINYLEILANTDSATSADLVRLEVLKYKVLDIE